jgi:hypothetical protein
MVYELLWMFYYVTITDLSFHSSALGSVLLGGTVHILTKGRTLYAHFLGPPFPSILRFLPRPILLFQLLGSADITNIIQNIPITHSLFPSTPPAAPPEATDWLISRQALAPNSTKSVLTTSQDWEYGRTPPASHFVNSCLPPHWKSNFHGADESKHFTWHQIEHQPSVKSSRSHVAQISI